MSVKAGSQRPLMPQSLGTRDYVAGRSSKPASMRSVVSRADRLGRSALLATVTTVNSDYAGAAMQGGTESLAGSGRAITRLAALAGFAP